MLVLARKRGEKIVIEGVGEVTVTRLSESRVTLAFDMPASVKIQRGELPGVKFGNLPGRKLARLWGKMGADYSKKYSAGSLATA